MGFLLRDQLGKFLATKMECSFGPMDALVAMALRHRATLQWLKLTDINKTIVETDSLLPASTTNNLDSYLSSLELITRDCVDLVRDILECLVNFIKQPILASLVTPKFSRSR